MKKILAKIFITLALVLTTINVCFPNDVDCSDSGNVPSISTQVESSNSSTPQEEHHCFCSLSCNTWIESFSSGTDQPRFVVLTYLPYIHTNSFYPQIILSTDKPPTV